MSDWKFLRNVLIKALGLFILFNLVFALINPMPLLGRLSLYNHLLPGRERLPFGEEPQKAYNLSLYNMEAMFASHELTAGQKPAGEFRVFVLGDSSVWGTLLEPQQTLAGCLNDLQLQAKDGRQAVFYNLGYPTMSLTKDMVILQEVRQYEPDLILLPLTLDSLPLQKQLESPLIANNPDRVRHLQQVAGLSWLDDLTGLDDPSFYDRTIIGQRRNLADMIRLQLYGFMYAATGIDQVYPESYEPAKRDFEHDDTFHDLESQVFDSSALAFDLLETGSDLSTEVPLVVINEPILRASGENSDIRYNFFYPRWAYDAYRFYMIDLSENAGWTYLDYWDLLPESAFTNSAVHLTPGGTQLFADQLAQDLQEYFLR